MLGSIIKHIALGVLSAYFIASGLVLLISSYTMKDPFYFTLSFFSSNLAILIGLAFLAPFALSLFRRLKAKYTKKRIP